MRKKILLFLFALLIFTGCEKEECVKRNLDQKMYLSADALIKFDYKEEYDFCKKGDKKYTKNNNITVTDFELVNSKAKEVFKDINFKGKSLEDSLKLVSNTLDSKSVNIDTIDIYNTSKNDYSNYLMFNVNNNYVDKKDIDGMMKKDMPLKVFSNQVVTGMEYYYEYYNFMNESEVLIYTDGACYGECDTSNTYKYTAEYDFKNNKMIIYILNNGYKSIYEYNFADDSFTYIGYENI